MVVNFPLFVELLKQKQESGDLTLNKVVSLRNTMSAIARPGCPVAMQQALGKMINEQLGQEVVKFK